MNQVATLFNEAPCLELREEDHPSAEDLATLLDDGGDEDSREKQVLQLAGACPFPRHITPLS